MGSTKTLKIALTLKSEQPLPRHSTVVVKKKGNLDIVPKPNPQHFEEPLARYSAVVVKRGNLDIIAPKQNPKDFEQAPC